jgi:hypothetical protein
MGPLGSHVTVVSRNLARIQVPPFRTEQKAIKGQVQGERGFRTERKDPDGPSPGRISLRF